MSAYGSIVSDVMVKGGTRCRLDTVTYTSPEFDELETLVGSVRTLCETEEPTMQAPMEQGPEPVIFVSPGIRRNRNDLCKHPVSDSASAWAEDLFSHRPISPTAGFSASRSYGLFPAFRAEYPSGRVAALHGAPPRMKETTMTDKQRAAKVLELLAERYPDLETHLMAESPWNCSSLRCSPPNADKRVNQVTPELFRRWPDPAALA